MITPVGGLRDHMPSYLSGPLGGLEQTALRVQSRGTFHFGLQGFFIREGRVMEGDVVSG